MSESLQKHFDEFTDPIDNEEDKENFQELEKHHKNIAESFEWDQDVNTEAYFQSLKVSLKNLKEEVQSEIEADNAWKEYEKIVNQEIVEDKKIPQVVEGPKSIWGKMESYRNRFLEAENDDEVSKIYDEWIKDILQVDSLEKTQWLLAKVSARLGKGKWWETLAMISASIAWVVAMIKWRFGLGNKETQDIAQGSQIQKVTPGRIAGMPNNVEWRSGTLFHNDKLPDKEWNIYSPVWWEVVGVYNEAKENWPNREDWSLEWENWPTFGNYVVIKATTWEFAGKTYHVWHIDKDIPVKVGDQISIWQKIAGIKKWSGTWTWLHYSDAIWPWNVTEMKDRHFTQTTQESAKLANISILKNEEWHYISQIEKKLA